MRIWRHRSGWINLDLVAHVRLHEETRSIDLVMASSEIIELTPEESQPLLMYLEAMAMNHATFSEWAHQRVHQRHDS